MANKILEDENGNISSKRIAGFITLSLALAMGGILFGFSIQKAIGDSQTALSVINTMLVVGGGLLGVGVFEKFGAKK